jgi:hypothetical protein
MVIHNKGDPDDYNTEPNHFSDEEDRPWPENKNNYEYNYKYDAQLPQVPEELSDTELGQKKDSEKSKKNRLFRIRKSLARSRKKKKKNNNKTR